MKAKDNKNITISKEVYEYLLEKKAYKILEKKEEVSFDDILKDILKINPPQKSS